MIQPPSTGRTDGRGYRAIAGLVRPDRKTVTKVIGVAVGLGLDRDGGVDQLDDGFVGEVMAAIRQSRPDRHGESWTLLEAEHDKIKKWVEAGDVPARKMCELLARSGVVVPERTVNRYLGARGRESRCVRRGQCCLARGMLVGRH